MPFRPVRLAKALRLWSKSLCGRNSRVFLSGRKHATAPAYKLALGFSVNFAIKLRKSSPDTCSKIFALSKCQVIELSPLVVPKRILQSFAVDSKSFN